MAALDLLRDARQVLADESNWCQHHAVHPSGRGTRPRRWNPAEDESLCS